MADVRIHLVRPDDADELVAGLRPSDRAECEAVDVDPAVGIPASVRQSLLCWSAREPAGLVCIFGVTPASMMGGVGSPWMMGTPLLEARAKTRMKVCPGYITRMLQAFPLLINWVHAENTTSVRWLKRLGFHMEQPAPYGPKRELFRRFEMRV